MALYISLIAMLLFSTTSAFSPSRSQGAHITDALAPRFAIPTNRRAFLTSAAGFVATVSLFSDKAIAVDDSVSTLIDQLVDSKKKVEQIPPLLQAGEWDSVRTILKTPPVNYLWNMGEGQNTLTKLSKATDEFELIDLKDELSISLQMCDQITYDNVFVYFQPGNGKVKVKEPIDLANKAIGQLGDAIALAKSAAH